MVEPMQAVADLTAPKREKLTDGMRRVLEDLAAGRSARHSLPPGHSAAGGFEGTLRALVKRGLISWEAHYVITDAGLAAIGWKPIGRGRDNA